ncbi:MAG: hypothetical protein BGO99_15130 [Nitrosospira sp. 56-18]|nr:MAG: hypothetical protein BGO99_15130 [Nitrosospira sp. 56-18]
MASFIVSPLVYRSFTKTKVTISCITKPLGNRSIQADQFLEPLQMDEASQPPPGFDKMDVIETLIIADY